MQVVSPVHMTKRVTNVLANVLYYAISGVALGGLLGIITILAVAFPVIAFAMLSVYIIYLWAAKNR